MDCPSSVVRARRGPPRARQACPLLLLVLASTSALGAPKTDTVVFHNGDRLTGEVKGLDRGQLSFDTDATGTIAIEWARTHPSCDRAVVSTGSVPRHDVRTVGEMPRPVGCRIRSREAAGRSAGRR